MKTILRRGLHKGLSVTWTLSKVIFPITLIITLLQYTPVLPYFIFLGREDTFLKCVSTRWVMNRLF